MAAFDKKQMDAIVSRFLGWKLPKTFSPDCWISFSLPKENYDKPGFWPVGTNLLTADEARAMLEHVLDVTFIPDWSLLEAAQASLREHGAALQRIGTALGLPAGSDVHRECVPAIESLLLRIREGIAADRCDGDSEYASGVNAACRNHLAFVDTVLADGGVAASHELSGDAVLEEVVKWALAGHIGEAGVTVEACDAIRAVARGVSDPDHQTFSTNTPMDPKC